MSEYIQIINENNLPRNFNNKIINQNEETVLIRSNVNGMDGINEWVKEFGAMTYTHWNSRDSRPKGQKFLCWKKFVCHHSAFMKTSSNLKRSKCCNCKASILIKIKLSNANTRCKDPYMKLGLSAEILIRNLHSHTLVTGETLQFLPSDENTKKRFLEYFDYGLGISESCRYHEQLIELEREYNEIELSSGRVNPTERTVRYWHDQWRQLNLGPRNGVGVMEILCNTAGNVNTESSF